MKATKNFEQMKILNRRLFMKEKSKKPLSKEEAEWKLKKEATLRKYQSWRNPVRKQVKVVEESEESQSATS